MRAIVLAVLLFSGAAHAASYAPPPGAPTVFVPSHGVEVGVWAAQTAIGHGIGVFEKSGTNPWTLCGICLASVEYPTLDSVVKAAGGPGPYVASVLPAVNSILAARYPAIIGQTTGATLDQVNSSLQGYALRIVGGQVALGGK